MPFTVFQDRAEAGQRLARALHALRGSRAIVIALPRGGVITGAALAEALGLPFDVLIVCHVHAPGRPELSIGALAEDGSLFLDWPVIQTLGLGPAELVPALEARRGEIGHLRRLYRGGRALPMLRQRPAVVVDDGAVTGYTLLAALQAVRRQRPSHLIVAVPVCPPALVPRLQAEADSTIVLATPAPFGSVGLWYRDFHDVTDEEIRNTLLARRPVQAQGA